MGPHEVLNNTLEEENDRSPPVSSKLVKLVAWTAVHEFCLPSSTAGCTGALNASQREKSQASHLVSNELWPNHLDRAIEPLRLRFYSLRNHSSPTQRGPWED